MKNPAPLLAAAVLAALSAFPPPCLSEDVETAKLTFAPKVPPPVNRKKPATVKVALETNEVEGMLMPGLGENTRYQFWTFNGRVPGPFIRAREGDTLELTLTNPKTSAMPHNIDLHAVTGPGGGAAVTLAAPGETKVARFKMLNSGLYVYHCAAPPVTDHIANGMYGLILVEPPGGLPPADREFYVMQSEFYTKEEFGHEGLVTYSHDKALEEEPTYVVFNGRFGSLMEEGSLKAKVGEDVRVYFGNAGPNKISSFHVIGAIFDRVYREGGVREADGGIQTTLVPAGGSAIVDFKLKVPGNYTLVDHAIFRLEKGAVGLLTAEGPEAPEIYKAVK